MQEPCLQSSTLNTNTLFLFQVSTPAELPAVSLTPKPEVPKTNPFTPPSAAFKAPDTHQNPPTAAAEASDIKVSSVEDDGDEELDQLLSLQKPVSGAEEGPPEEGKLNY